MVLIKLGKENSNGILNVAPEILLQAQDNIKSKVLLDNDEKPIGSFFDLHKITKVLVTADFYIEEKQYPIHISRFRKTESNESIAEVATADIKIEEKKFRVDILAPNSSFYLMPYNSIAR